ncbi:TPA: hypothetical protein ACYEOW_003283 [Raoultella terrigena]
MKIDIDEPTYLALQQEAKKRNLPLAGMINTMCRNMVKLIQERDEIRELKQAATGMTMSN